ncbi:hypothetical protein [Sporosarcina sp. FSL W7-1283]|uniref:hypothetical protein n=1 Tax=Sporosarcina sp. FSL W7-1283 TaxID=2921560 RepID=UPI0030F5611F
MSTEVNVENATVNLILTINGYAHLVGMSQDNLDAISYLVKQATEVVVPTGRNQLELNEFLNYKS